MKWLGVSVLYEWYSFLLLIWEKKNYKVLKLTPIKTNSLTLPRRLFMWIFFMFLSNKFDFPFRIQASWMSFQWRVHQRTLTKAKKRNLYVFWELKIIDKVMEFYTLISKWYELLKEKSFNIPQNIYSWPLAARNLHSSAKNYIMYPFKGIFLAFLFYDEIISCWQVFCFRNPHAHIPQDAFLFFYSPFIYYVRFCHLNYVINLIRIFRRIMHSYDWITRRWKT